MMAQKTIKHVLTLNRSESKNGSPNETQNMVFNTMVFDISPTPDSPWITLFTNIWEMERSNYVPEEYQGIDFNFDANNLSRLIVTYPSTLNKIRVEQEMRKLKDDADKEAVINQIES